MESAMNSNTSASHGPRLPDVYGKRPSPSFGRPNQLAPVVEDKGIGEGLVDGETDNPMVLLTGAE